MNHYMPLNEIILHIIWTYIMVTDRLYLKNIYISFILLLILVALENTISIA